MKKTEIELLNELIAEFSYKEGEFEKDSEIFYELSDNLAKKFINKIKENINDEIDLNNEKILKIIKDYAWCGAQLLLSNFFFFIFDEKNPESKYVLELFNDNLNEKSNEKIKAKILWQHNSDLLFWLTLDQIYEVFKFYIHEIKKTKTIQIRSRSYIVLKNGKWIVKSE